MNRSATSLVLSALATAMLLGSAFASGDFIETIAAQAPLLTPDGAEDCKKAAEAQLSEPLELLKKRCVEAGGQFNVGLVTPSLHRRSCSVYQAVTCSATDGAQEAAVEAVLPNGEPSSKPAEKKPEPKKKRRKPRPGERQVQAASQAPKAK